MLKGVLSATRALNLSAQTDVQDGAASASASTPATPNTATSNTTTSNTATHHSDSRAQQATLPLEELIARDIDGLRDTRATIESDLHTIKERVDNQIAADTSVQENDDTSLQEKRGSCLTLKQVLLLAKQDIADIENTITDVMSDTSNRQSLSVLDQALEKKDRQLQEANHTILSNTTYSSPLSEQYQQQKNRLEEERDTLSQFAESTNEKINNEVETTMQTIHTEKEAVEQWVDKITDKNNQTITILANEQTLDEEISVQMGILEQFKEDLHDAASVPGSIELQRKIVGFTQFVASNVKLLASATASPDILLRPDKQSHYGSTHIIAFQHEQFLDPVFTESEATTRHHFTKKGIKHIQSHRANIEDVRDGNVDPVLKANLHRIPTGGAAALSTVKPTKITLDVHGNQRNTNLSVLSAGESDDNSKYENVSATAMGKYLTDHLKLGDYKGKLTIALRACYGGQETPDKSQSTLREIAEILKAHKYTGIKLTAATLPTSTEAISTPGSSVMGSTMAMIDDDGQKVKLSESDDNKVVITL